MKRVDVASAFIQDKNGNILLVKNLNKNSFYWGIPGGAVENNETLEQAAVREVKEETGFNIEVSGLHSIREVFFEERNHHALIVTFFANIIDGHIEIHDPDCEIAEVKWVDDETARKLMPFLYEKLRIDSDDNKTLAYYTFEGIR